MQRDKMLEARQLITEKRYSEARLILEAVDHPTAKQWLQKLDEIERRPSGMEASPSVPMPALPEPAVGEPRNETSRRSLKVIGAGVVIIVLVVVAAITLL